ncbi:lyase family protein [uncultured Dubosiella sp.]|uniref:class II fumarate hydratase n=1 Tax=uncultured Dubosiella sp. TaxID=1937011 RepID=UPI0025B5686E|nr:class II fumarate hydratase [uncultured Dubosiella sp.]
MEKVRIETDVLGEIAVPADKYWKSQTQRSLENFRIGTEKMPKGIIRSFMILKKACAQANLAFGKISEKQADAIVHVCDEVLAGQWMDQFPLSVWQTGSGTQTNMNVNEVITMLGNAYADEQILSANDVVNCSQSSNDTFPAALHILCALEVHERLLPALDRMIAQFSVLEKENAGIIKIGRTHLQDATPLYFSQELSGYRSMLEHSRQQILAALPFIYELACGATAVGSGINCPVGFDLDVTGRISASTGLPFVPDPNKFHALTSKDACAFLSGGLKALAANLMKIANDIRLLASGPRCNIHEIDIPANEPGSSIMPGKVNPTQCESMTMVCVQVMGNDATVGFAASQGQFELNVFMPVIAYNLDQSIRLLSDSMNSFCTHCLSGLKANEEKMREYVDNSLMLVTCLNPVIGYKKAAQAAQYAHQNDISLKEAITTLGYLSEEEFDRYVDAKKMIHTEL